MTSLLLGDRQLHLLRLLPAGASSVLSCAEERCLSPESRLNLMASDTMCRSKNICAVRVVDRDTAAQFSQPLDLRSFPIEAVSVGAKAVTGALAGGVAGLAVGRVIPQLQEALVEGCGAAVQAPKVCKKLPVVECYPEECEEAEEAGEAEAEQIDDGVASIFKQIRVSTGDSSYPSVH